MSAAPKFKNNVKISQRHGAREWLLEKVLLAILMPLSIWVAFTGFTLAGADATTVARWFATAPNLPLLGVTVVVFFAFAHLAWKVIIEDYVPSVSGRAVLSRVSMLVFAALAGGTLFFIVRAAQALTAGA